MISSRSISLLSLLAILIPLINAQYTLDPCRCDAECEGGRICIFFEAPFTFELCGPDKKGCTCAFGTDGNLRICTFDFDCPEGDICVSVPTPTGPISSCISMCARTRENCPESPEKPECDPQPQPVVTPTPSTTPRPSRRPSPSATPRPSRIPDPTGSGPILTPIGPTEAPPPEEPDETPVDSPNMDMQESPEPVFTPEVTRRPRRPNGGTRTGLTGDSCTEASDCRGSRRCYTVGTKAPCDPLESCYCQPVTPRRCDDDKDCVNGEQCSDASGENICVSTCSIYKTEEPELFEAMCKSENTKRESDPDRSPTLVSSPESPSPESTAPPETPTPSPSPTEAICVAAEELEGVEKVFEKDFHAWVLCDAGGSCATPGHMVMWNGAGMMMKSYCDVVGCEKKVMAVNSPRWKAGVVQAKTNGLAYTSFAARFETRAEERVLAAIVRLV